jgi:hypothetical protein
MALFFIAIKNTFNETIFQSNQKAFHKFNIRPNSSVNRQYIFNEKCVIEEWSQAEPLNMLLLMF